jgi:hypothetical protein
MKCKTTTATVFTLVFGAFVFGQEPQEPTANNESILRQNKEMLKHVFESRTIISEMPEFAYIERNAKKTLASNEVFQRLIQAHLSECNWILQLNEGCFENDIVHVISCVAQPDPTSISQADEDLLSFLCRLAARKGNVTFDRIQSTGQNRIIVIESGAGRNGRIRRKLTREYTQTFEGEKAKWIIVDKNPTVLPP